MSRAVKKPHMDYMSQRGGGGLPLRLSESAGLHSIPGARTCSRFEEGLLVAWTRGWLSTHWVQGEGGAFKDLERWRAPFMMPP